MEPTIDSLKRERAILKSYLFSFRYSWPSREPSEHQKALERRFAEVSRQLKELQNARGA